MHHSLFLGFSFLFSVRTPDNSFSCSRCAEMKGSCIYIYPFYLFILASDLLWEFTAGVWLGVSRKNPWALVVISWLPTEHHCGVFLTLVKPPVPGHCLLLLEMSWIRNSHRNRQVCPGGSTWGAGGAHCWGQLERGSVWERAWSWAWLVVCRCPADGPGHPPIPQSQSAKWELCSWLIGLQNAVTYCPSSY